MQPYRKENIPLARELRKNMTPWERKLWYQYLREYPVRFRRQYILGEYIADFYCAAAKLVIELDGGGHYEEAQIAKDAERSRELEKTGLKVLRISNLDIDRCLPAVCEQIDMTVKERVKKEATMKNIILYTDGACSGNPGPGGWAAILRYGSSEKVLSGGEAQTTNNRMELLGVIHGLQALKEPCQVTLYTDSQYIVNALNNGWLRDWKKRGWKRRDGELKNTELWQTLDGLLATHNLTAVWVKGHAENEYNNRCDALAVQEREKFA